VRTSPRALVRRRHCHAAAGGTAVNRNGGGDACQQQPAAAAAAGEKLWKRNSSKDAMALPHRSSLHLPPRSLIIDGVDCGHCPTHIIFYVAPTLKYLSIPNSPPTKKLTMDSSIQLQPQPCKNALLQEQQQPPPLQPPPRVIGGKSDLLARLSDFLPRIRAANAALHDENAVDNGSEALLDGGLQIVNETDESSSSSDSSNSSDSDEEEENDSNDDKQGIEHDSGSGTTEEQQRPRKQAKLSKRHGHPTVVLSLQLTPENNPLFQALHQDDASGRGVDNAVTTNSPVVEEQTKEDVPQPSGDSKAASIQRLLALPAIQNKSAASLEPRGPLITEL
jgi:hypothetical protein